MNSIFDDKKKNYIKGNPLIISNPKIEALEDAYKLFLEAIDEYSKLNDLNEEELNEIKNTLNEIYKNKKIQYFLEQEMNIILNKFKILYEDALKESSAKNMKMDYYLNYP